jgi:hypothetical protein
MAKIIMDIVSGCQIPIGFYMQNFPVFVALVCASWTSKITADIHGYERAWYLSVFSFKNDMIYSYSSRQMVRYLLIWEHGA